MKTKPYRWGLNLNFYYFSPIIAVLAWPAANTVTEHGGELNMALVWEDA